MIKRNWYAYVFGAIATVAIMVGGAALWNYRHEQALARVTAATTDIAQTSGPAPIKCVLTSKTSLGCTLDLPTPSGRDGYDRADLKAQQDSAAWGFVSMLVGIFGLLSTITGVWYVALSLRETRKATNAAVVASKAAVKTMRLERAWVVFKDFTPQLTTPADAEPGILIDAFFINAGRTPALNCQFAAKMKTFNSVQEYLDLEFDVRDNKLGGRVVSPGAVCSV